jgi:hypothetical protein
MKEGECIEITLRDIENVPVPKSSNDKDSNGKGLFNLEDVVARELRIILFDADENKYISNTYIVPAIASADGLKWKFDFSESIKAAKKFMFKND